MCRDGAGEYLDGKALFCTSKSDKRYPVYGLVFDQGKVTKYQLAGYSKVRGYLKPREFYLIGSHIVEWYSGIDWLNRLNRKTLTVFENAPPFRLHKKKGEDKKGRDQCSLSSKKEIFQKLDAIIATAKK